MIQIVKSGKISLEPEAVEALVQMCKILNEENGGVKASPSQIVSQSLIEYADRYFERDKDRIMALIFDKRSYNKGVDKRAKTDKEYDELIEKGRSLGSKREKILSLRAARRASVSVQSEDQN